jgi:hypothetical protein
MGILLDICHNNFSKGTTVVSLVWCSFLIVFVLNTQAKYVSAFTKEPSKKITI